MSKELLRHFRNYIKIDEKDEAKILSHFKLKIFAKKENLINGNSKCRFHFFVNRGCLRMFYISDNGTEQTTQFAIENWWLTDYLSFEKQAQTEFTIQAVETSEVLVIDYNSQEKLLHDFPNIERYFRLIYQRNYAASQIRAKYMYNFSKEEIFHHFSTRFPEFVKRVPQYLLASYLNMTPEYLSEIKSKIRS